MKLDKKKKEILKSYLRSVAAASITTALALIADWILAGAIVAPLARYFDPQDDKFGINSK
jgi:Gpi18-like mannosyltransferase